MKLFIKTSIIAIFLFSGVGIAAELNLTGSIISDNQKIITSRYMGFVKSVHVSEGEDVQKGDLLYEIDSKEIDSAKAQVELSIAQAQLSKQMYENQYQNTLLNLSRHKRLYKKDMVSKFEVENLELASKNLKAMVEISTKQIKQVKARLQEVKNQYKYLSIQAPNNAVVIQKNIKVGEMAMPGVPALVLSDLSNLKVITEIPESNLKSVKEGMEVEYEIPSIKLKGVGLVDSIIPSSNPMTHTFKMKVTLNTDDKNIYPGMYVLIRVK